MRFTRSIKILIFRYYMSMVEEKHYAVDQEKLKEYFPVDVVTGNWSLRQDFLDIRFII